MNIIYKSIGICLLLTIQFSIANNTTTNYKMDKLTSLQQSDIVKVTYQLKGFNQSCCGGIVNYSLKELPGFVKSETNVKNQEITIWYDKSKSKEADIKAAINKTAYKIVK